MAIIKFLCMFSFITLNTCGNSEMEKIQESKILYVNSKTVDCMGVGPQKCMLTRENPKEEWTYFYDKINGFDYKEGNKYTIEVAVTTIQNPPADGSSLSYSLIKIISEEKAEITKAIKKVVYQTSSRGFFESIEITSDLVKKTKDRSNEKFQTKACKKEDWDALITIIKPIDLSIINNLKAPSDDRARDATLQAKVLIIEGDITYESTTFDHKNPPNALKPLVNQILSLAENIE